MQWSAWMTLDWVTVIHYVHHVLHIISSAGMCMTSELWCNVKLCHWLKSTLFTPYTASVLLPGSSVFCFCSVAGCFTLGSLCASNITGHSTIILGARKLGAQVSSENTCIGTWSGIYCVIQNQHSGLQLQARDWQLSQLPWPGRYHLLSVFWWVYDTACVTKHHCYPMRYSW